MTQLNAAMRLVATGVQNVKHQEGGRTWSFEFEGQHFVLQPANEALYVLEGGKKELIPHTSPLYKVVMEAAHLTLYGNK